MVCARGQLVPRTLWSNPQKSDGASLLLASNLHTKSQCHYLATSLFCVSGEEQYCKFVLSHVDKLFSIRRLFIVHAYNMYEYICTCTFLIRGL